MENLSFVLWMLLYGLIHGLDSYITYRITGKPPEERSNIVLWIHAILYFGVGYLLYKK